MLPFFLLICSFFSFLFFHVGQVFGDCLALDLPCGFSVSVTYTNLFDFSGNSLLILFCGKRDRDANWQKFQQ